MNILIRAKRKKVEHKFERNLEENDYCYWTGIRPRKAEKGDKVMFTDGKTVYAEGTILGVDERNGLLFTPLKEKEYRQPKKAPTRGFTYV